MNFVIGGLEILFPESQRIELAINVIGVTASILSLNDQLLGDENRRRHAA